MCPSMAGTEHDSKVPLFLTLPILPRCLPPGIDILHQGVGQGWPIRPPWAVIKSTNALVQSQFTSVFTTRPGSFNFDVIKLIKLQGLASDNLIKLYRMQPNYVTKWADFQIDQFLIHISQLITCLPYHVNRDQTFHLTKPQVHSSSMSGSCLVGRGELSQLQRLLIEL